MERAKITLHNWGKYHSNTDRIRNPNFMKVALDIFASDSLHGLSPAQKWFWQYLVRQCTKSWSEKFEFNMKHAISMSGVSKIEIMEAIEILDKNGTLTVEWQENVSKMSSNCQLGVRPKTQSRVDKSRVEGTEPQISDSLKKGNEIETGVSLNHGVFSAVLDKSKPTATTFVIPLELMNSWIKTYKDEDWISFEIQKARNWCIANSSKAPKSNFTKFFNGWLCKGWEYERKQRPSNKDNKSKKHLEDLKRAEQEFLDSTGKGLS